MKEKVIVIGDGGHAKIVIDILREMGTYEIIGVTSKQADKQIFYDLPILGNDDILVKYQKEGINNVAIGIGGFKDNELRTRIFNDLFSKGFNIINVIHPKSIIANSVILGKGVVIFAGVILNTGVNLGDNVIVATGSTVDHETIIDKHCLISAGVTIGANTRINSGTLCALGSKVISGITIGENVLVAAGAVVVSNLKTGSKVFGIPAKEK